ncbi:hypothetical protein BJ944DRAFT_163813 [Cunninghamella echinulata]|nr:hypothetical protein BJ944DRAFT_163813 [Cunninghamella echinulata]
MEHRWIVHKSTLSHYSPYFEAMFEHEFYESTASVICLPSSILNYYGINAVIHYMYYSRDFKDWLDRNYHEAQDKLLLLQDAYATADYFGMGDFCLYVIECLNDLVHQWNCQCDDCLYVIPQLYEYTYMNYNHHYQKQLLIQQQKIKDPYINQQQNDHDLLLNKICSKAIHCLTHDPEKCLPNFWTHRNMARMLDGLSNDQQLMFSRRICKRITKCNAVESLHACFLATTTLASTDPILCWSRSLHATLASVQAKSTQLIAKHFNYYCSQYPTLLSCIDGITYSFEYLEYLFMHVLEDQMDISNAGLLYQGIIRDLLCRHSVQYNDQVKHILNVAKDIILQYMSNRIDIMKKMAALDDLDTEVIKTLSSARQKSKMLVVGKRVQLNRRPVLTVGTVKYVGPVSFADGIWVGVELDRRVGKNDGSVDGERYFSTSPNRGVFVRSDDLKVMF